MKKLYVIMVVLLMSNFLPAQQKFYLDYLKHKSNLKHSGDLMGGDKCLFVFNSDIWVPINLLSQMWDNSDWQNMAYTQFYYDANGQCTSDLSQSWADGTWVNNLRTTYTYDGNLQTIAESENWENEMWVSAYKSFWTYNANGRVTNILDLIWTNNEWVNSMQTTYTYSGENCTELLIQYWVNGAWETQHRTTYEYDAEGNNTVSTSETWIMGILITSKEISTFDQGLRVSVLRQNLEGTDWVDASRANYSYNANRQQTQFVSEQWTGSEWVYTMQGLYTYDENGNNTEALTQNWEDNAWVNFMKLTYNYQSVTDVENKEISITNFKLFNNYPNPFNPSTFISYQLPTGSYVTLKIYNLLGDEVAILVNEFKPAGSYDKEFNASSLPSGVYYYRLQAGDYINTKKMLMLK